MSRRFAMSFSTPMRWLLTLFGIPPSRCWVDVGDDRLELRMGWSGNATVDRAAIRSAGRWTGAVWAWGIHGWRGRWLFNGSSDGIVSLALDPPQPGRVLLFRLRIHELRVSLEQPDELIAAVIGDG